MWPIRLLTVSVTALWVAAMVLLFQHDIVPRLLAGDPPLQAAQAEKKQYGIYTGQGVRVGTSWVDVQPAGKSLAIRTNTMLDQLAAVAPIASLVPEGAVRIQTDLIYFDNEINSLDLNVWGLPVPVQAHGGRVGAYFAVQMQAGTFKSAMTLRGEEALAISDLLRPMTRLKNLQVGKSWNVKMIEPFSLTGTGRFRNLLVRVTGQEERTVEGRTVSCFKVESEGGLTAWVEPSGEVVEQVVKPTGLGASLRMLREPYQHRSHVEAYLHVPGGRSLNLK